ncbi:MAG: aspartate--tRNA(Asn) ligase [Candidatus Heimdallarchaeum endolithica]|uniref:Aspartate--tRNA(Asp/Asn) ligase n=1 Tax=Candidatus Heimdallarchaeum endolithica TaxID=2876572 RepID=A0A9Y1BP18_9ARCH|nr:MAG: aspartate--tRNA(Asn) ligase [Candidatus Heimdallarchaeum endolithica]
MDFKDRTQIANIFTSDPGTVTIAGWVQQVRNLGGLKFIQLQDRSGLVQIVLPKKKVSPEIFTIDYQEGDILLVQGKVVSNNSAPKGKEILPSTINVVNKRQQEYPIAIDDKINTNIDKRLDYRYLDLRNRSVSQIFEVESAVAYAFQEFFYKKNFLQFFSSKIVGSATESGANVFEIGYFGRKAYLAQSPQFYKQMMLISGFEKVFEIGPVFRAEKHHTSRHLCEYTSIDFEIAYINDQRDVMKVLQEAIMYTLDKVRKEKADSLEELGVVIDMQPKQWPILSHQEIHEILENEGKELGEYEDLDAEAEKILGEYVKEKYKSDFVFADEYPWEVRPFYTMKKEDNNNLTKSFDLLYKGQELTTGGQREHRADILEKQAEEKGFKKEEVASYIQFFRNGAPPHGGSGTGIERFVQKLLNLPNIREARLLPRDPTRVHP